MQPLKLKIISWLSAFAIGVALTFVVQLYLRPPANRSITQMQPPAQQLAPLAKETEEPPAEPEPTPSGKFSNFSIIDKAEGFYTNEVDYPQLAVLTARAARRFNHRIEELIMKRLADARRQGREIRRDFQQKGEANQSMGGLTTTYEILFASPNIISINFTHSYVSTFHPIDSFESINYDLKTGRQLQLEDIFKPKAKYLEALSKSSRAKLVESLQLSEIDSWMKEGTAPLNKNFEAWNITGQGITISFGDYQIGPYAMGKAQVTIPFRDLENLLKSNWLSQQKLPQVADSQ